MKGLTSKPKKTSEDLSVKAYDGIRKMLFHNEIVAGQKIPFKDLALEMNMSVTPVIQALKFLEFQGLVRREPNKGYFIEPLTLEEVNEIYHFRELLEVSLIAQTIKKLDDSGIAKLQLCHDNYSESLAGVFINKKLITDMEFHLMIARLSGEKIRYKSLKNTFDLLHLKYKTSLQYVTSEKSNDKDHQYILEAIIARETETAKKLLSQHINNSRKHACLNLTRMMEEKASMFY